MCVRARAGAGGAGACWRGDVGECGGIGRADGASVLASGEAVGAVEAVWEEPRMEWRQTREEMRRRNMRALGLTPRRTIWTADGTKGCTAVSGITQRKDKGERTGDLIARFTALVSTISYGK